MKKIFAALAAGLVALSLGACSSTQQQSATAALAKLQTDVANGCTVVEPTLQSVAAFDPAVVTAATANGLFCATASAITITSTQSLIGSGIPAIEQAVAASTLIPADQKAVIVASLGVFQLTVTNALAAYGKATVTAAPASGASAAASTPLAGVPLQ
ncbi:hypothetical protein [Burkholderia territorii]|uniref:hypothetical protein n=1 Tax=Burkholderia territorii TaxID=1503055 RepID=UPI000758290A|nr:hypothetical protein [Burkholderia territorii]KWO62540.1 hypothetical protein WT98_30180 [Burkholderia territorii]